LDQHRNSRMKILFPIDMTNPVAAIINQVSAILPMEDRTVHLLYVNETWPAYENLLGMSGQFADDWNKIVTDHAEKTMEEAISLLTGKCREVTTEIVSGPPALMIETVAADEHFDLTVLIPGKHPVLETVLVGSVSSKVVKHGHGAMLIVRPSAKFPAELKNVLIGLDGSANAKEAMMKSVDLFGLVKRDVNVVLMHAVDVAEAIKCMSPVEFFARIEQNLILEGETFLAEGKRLLMEAGIKRVDIVLKQGKPVHEMIEAAKALPADLIIAGAEGHSPVEHFLVGSVSHRLAMHAPCAVAIIKKQVKS
jgi:nucleotide-binding universal stress UspA family protein